MSGKTNDFTLAFSDVVKYLFGAHSTKHDSVGKIDQSANVSEIETDSKSQRVVCPFPVEMVEL